MIKNLRIFQGSNMLQLIITLNSKYDEGYEMTFFDFLNKKIEVFIYHQEKEINLPFPKALNDWIEENPFIQAEGGKDKDEVSFYFIKRTALIKSKLIYHSKIGLKAENGQ